MKKIFKAKMKWQKIKAVLERISACGKQDVSLAEFVAQDRYAHKRSQKNQRNFCARTKKIMNVK